MSGPMSAGEYFAWIIGGIALLVVCAMGALWLGSLARQAWKDFRGWLALRWARRFIGDIRLIEEEHVRARTRRALAAANRGEVEHCKDTAHLMRQIRQGKLGL